MSLRVTIKVNDVWRYINVEKAYWDSFGPRTLENLKDIGLRVLQEEVPVRTGTLQASCWSEIAGNTVRLGTATKYSEHVDGYGKTSPSVGRYVPAIERKLVRPSRRNPDIGMHPGSRKTPFSDRTRDRMRDIASLLLKEGIRGRLE